MAGYDFLKGVVVVEVAQLGMDSLGGYLADMGARVIKVEQPVRGDPVRYTGEYAIGSPDGVGLLHLRWNRGKESIALDYSSPRGAELFLKLSAKADIVIDGLKGGSLERRGLGYDTLAKKNPALVYCTISGLGTWGPYHRLRSHATAYDAYAGLLDGKTDQPPGRGEFKSPPVGMNAPGLYAGIGVLSALVRAGATGKGARLEVTGIDAAANFVPEIVDCHLNSGTCFDRRAFHDATGRMRNWPRLWNYETADGRLLHLQVFAPKTWEKFCRALDREDLLELPVGKPDDATYNQTLLVEISAIVRQRTLTAWMAFFVAHDISAMPLNDVADLASDETFQSRRAWYEKEMPGVGMLRLTGTPIHVEGADFAPELAPELGEHTENVLSELLELSPFQIGQFRRSGAIA